MRGTDGSEVLKHSPIALVTTTLTDSVAGSNEMCASPRRSWISTCATLSSSDVSCTP